MASPATKAQKGIRARQDAIKELIIRHQDEFDEMHTKNRVKMGLSPRTNGPDKKQLQERIRRQEERLEKWRRELELAS